MPPVPDTSRETTVTAFTLGSDVPSSRFRMGQLVTALGDHGFRVHESCPPFPLHPSLPGVLNRVRRRYLLPVAAAQLLCGAAVRAPAILASRRRDLVWINRNLLPGLDELVGLARRPRLLDVDDAVWLSNPRGQGATVRLAGRVDGVIAGNDYLAEWYGRHNSQVEVVPTAVDCERFVPGPRTNGQGDGFVLGWTGTAGNHPNLALAWPAVRSFLEAHSQARFLVVCDRRPAWWPGDSERLVFRKWSAATEVTDLQAMDVGLMPLADTAWTRGKCAFKMLLYMAAGLPVVVSPVGMNADVLAQGPCGLPATTEAQWRQAFEDLLADGKARRELGIEGRRIVTNDYSVPVVARRVARIFRRWAP